MGAWDRLVLAALVEAAVLCAEGRHSVLAAILAARVAAVHGSAVRGIVLCG